MRRILRTLRWIPLAVFLWVALTACPPATEPFNSATDPAAIHNALLATSPIQDLQSDVEITEFNVDSCYRGGVAWATLYLALPEAFSKLGIHYTYLLRLNAYPDGKFNFTSLDGGFNADTVRQELSRLRDMMESDIHIKEFARVYPYPSGSLNSGEITRTYTSGSGELFEDYLIRVAYDTYNGKIAHYGVYNDTDWPFDELTFIHTTLTEKAFTGDLANCQIDRQPGSGYTIVYPYTDSWRVEIQLVCPTNKITWSGEVSQDGSIKLINTRSLTSE